MPVSFKSHETRFVQKPRKQGISKSQETHLNSRVSVNVACLGNLDGTFIASCFYEYFEFIKNQWEEVNHFFIFHVDALFFLSFECTHIKYH